MHGVKRVVIFCVMTAILPTVLIITPLYLRHSVFADVSYPVAESDVVAIMEGISSVFCESQSLRMNTTFNAFQLRKSPPLSKKRKHIRLKKSMTLPDDTLEYWGFYLLKGATVYLKVCSRYEGSRILVVRGEKNLNTCGLLEHNFKKFGATMDQDYKQVKVTFEHAQEIDDSRMVGDEGDNNAAEVVGDYEDVAAEVTENYDDYTSKNTQARNGEDEDTSTRRKYDEDENTGRRINEDRNNDEGRNTVRKNAEDINLNGKNAEDVNLNGKNAEDVNLNGKKAQDGNLNGKTTEGITIGKNSDEDNENSNRRKPFEDEEQTDDYFIKTKTTAAFNRARVTGDEDLTAKNLNPSQINESDENGDNLKLFTIAEDSNKRKDDEQKNADDHSSSERLNSVLSKSEGIEENASRIKLTILEDEQKQQGDVLKLNVHDANSRRLTLEEENRYFNLIPDDLMREKLVSKRKLKSAENINESRPKLRRHSKGRLSKRLFGTETRNKRDLNQLNQLDGGIEHGGNAFNYTHTGSNENSVSSFETDLLTCYDGSILLTAGFNPSDSCTEVRYLELGEHIETVHEVVSDGYYYYIFYSDNDFITNDIHAIFDIHKPTYRYANNTKEKECVNVTECRFSIAFWSDETVIVEIPTLDGIEKEEDDIALLISTCHPRMGVYLFFPIAVIFLILGCSFL